LDWSWKGEEEASSREEGGSSTNSNSVADGCWSGRAQQQLSEKRVGVKL